MNTNLLLKFCTVSVVVMLFCTSGIRGQIPGTDLFLFQLVKDDSSHWHIHSPQLLSDFNAGGYTNQPEFISDEELYVSVNFPGDTQNDIYALHLDNLTQSQVTKTPESEFSPLMTPDGNAFSCVRQVLGDSVDQQIFRFPIDRSYPGAAALPGVKTVGYHCWLSNEDVAMFLVGEPVRLALANTRTEEYRIVASNIGRSLRRTPDGHLAFVHKYNDDFWYLKTLDPSTRRSEIVVESLKGQEDFVIGPGGEYFMGMDSVLYVFDSKNNKQWQPVFDLSIYGIEKITRLAINGRYQLALVAQKP